MSEVDQIDLNELSVVQLRQLNARIVERLKYLNAVHTLKNMNRLHMGQSVCFEADGQIISGTLVKLNQKTVVVLAQDGLSWRVSPQFIQPLIEGPHETGLTSIPRK